MKTLFCLILLNILLVISLNTCIIGASSSSNNYNNNLNLIENVTILGDMILSEDQWQDMIEEPEPIEEDYDLVSDINDSYHYGDFNQQNVFINRY